MSALSGLTVLKNPLTLAVSAGGVNGLMDIFFSETLKCDEGSQQKKIAGRQVSSFRSGFSFTLFFLDQLFILIREGVSMLYNPDFSKMDVRQILTYCFHVPAEDMKGDSIGDVFSSLRENGSKHVVDGLLTIFDRYAEEQASCMKGEVFNSSQKIFDALRLMFVGKKQEEFFVVLLDNRFRAIDEPILITKGTLNRSLVHPREVFAPAVEARAAACFLIHCHPERLHCQHRT